MQNKRRHLTHLKGPANSMFVGPLFSETRGEATTLRGSSRRGRSVAVVTRKGCSNGGGVTPTPGSHRSPKLLWPYGVTAAEGQRIVRALPSAPLSRTNSSPGGVTDWKTGPVEPARYTDRGQCHLYAVMLIPGVPQKGTHRRSSSSQLHKVWRFGPGPGLPIP